VQGKLFGEQGRLPTFQSGIESSAAEAETRRKRYTDILSRFDPTGHDLTRESSGTGGNLTPEEKEFLGYGAGGSAINYPAYAASQFQPFLDVNNPMPESWGRYMNENIYNKPVLDTGDFIRRMTEGGDINPQQFATPEQYAEYEALAKLAGIDPTFLSPMMKEMAGTQKRPDFSPQIAGEQLSGISQEMLNQIAGLDIPSSVSGVSDPTMTNYWGKPTSERDYWQSQIDKAGNLLGTQTPPPPESEIAPLPDVTMPGEPTPEPSPWTQVGSGPATEEEYTSALQGYLPGYTYLGNRNWRAPNGKIWENVSAPGESPGAVKMQ
jgi:hypothetical protein